MLRLYDSGRVSPLRPARPDVVRVGGVPDLRTLVICDLVRRVCGLHKLRTIGIWPEVPGTADLNIRPAELSSGGVDVEVRTARWSAPHLNDKDPLALRLALLSVHYRADAAVEPGERHLTDLRRQVASWASAPGRPADADYVAEAMTAFDDDLDVPAVFQLLERLTHDETVSEGAKFETAIHLDLALGLDLVRLIGHT